MKISSCGKGYSGRNLPFFNLLSSNTSNIHFQILIVILCVSGLGDRHGENISFDSTNGDTVHVDFNCLFNKGEAFEWPERVPFRLTHNMEAAMGPLRHEGMFRYCWL